MLPDPAVGIFRVAAVDAAQRRQQTDVNGIEQTGSGARDQELFEVSDAPVERRPKSRKTAESWQIGPGGCTCRLPVA